MSSYRYVRFAAVLIAVTAGTAVALLALAGAEPVPVHWDVVTGADRRGSAAELAATTGGVVLGSLLLGLAARNAVRAVALSVAALAASLQVGVLLSVLS